MIERPLDRLNYYNGQRLEASDLKLEQEYHIRVRRWLNKSLYQPGIASGLEVRAEGDTRNVIVSPGLALDAEGREILLLEEEYVFVPGRPHKIGGGSAAEVEGLYLTIRYNEKSIEEERNGCIPRSAQGQKNGDRAARGGPALVRAKPLFNWSDALPFESSGEILLAQVELTSLCDKVSQVNTGVRRYVGPASSSKVRQYALDGEREVALIPKEAFPTPPTKDVEVVGRIYFHIRGRQPNAVTLYLRGEQFSPLRYTELGKHNHSISVGGTKKTLGADPALPKLTIDNNDGTHTHGASALLTVGGIGAYGSQNNQVRFRGFYVTNKAENAHNIVTEDGSQNTHAVVVRLDQPLDLPYGLPGQPAPPPPPPPLPPPTQTYPPRELGALTILSDKSTHKHILMQNQQPFQGYTHTHAIDLSVAPSSGDFGTERPARSGPQLSYVDDLQIFIGPPGRTVNRTNDIQLQLAAANPTDWADNAGNAKKLGDGSENNVLNEKGTGPIHLDFLPGVQFTEDQYCIELSVKAGANGQPNGGRILYNLYVE